MGLTGTYGPDAAVLAPGDVVSISNQGDCASAPFAEVSPTVAILDANNMGVFDFKRATPSDSNKICVCPKAVYTGAVACAAPIFAGLMTIQDEITDVLINGIPGTFLNVPQGWCEGGGTSCTGPKLFMSYDRPTGTIGYVSLTAIDQSCKTPAGNPTTASATASGRLSTDLQRMVTSSLVPFRQMAPGLYKVCMKPDLNTLFNWKETGIVLALRPDISGLQVNGLASVASVAPQTSGVRLRVCRQADCAVAAEAGSTISLIPSNQECADPATNPANPAAGVSGHVPVGPQGLVDQGKTDDLLKENSQLGMGRRQVCYKAKGASAFVPTGLTLAVQDAVLGLEVNGVRNKRGLMPVIPRASGIHLRYFRRDSKATEPGESFALVPPDALCELLCQTQKIPVCDAAVPTQHAPSGFLSAHTADGSIGTTSCLRKASQGYDPATRVAGDINCDAAVSGNPDMSALPPASYQLCYRGASTCAYFSCWPTWEATGIHVRVQEQVVALELHPGRGLDSGYGLVMRGLQLTTVPNDWHSLSFVGGTTGTQVVFALMPPDADCEALDAAGSQAGVQIGPLPSAGHLADPAQVAAALRARGVGVQNVCMRVGGGQYSSSGLSVRIQADISAIVVNGVQPNRGVLVPVPAVGTSKIMLAGARAPKVGDMISFIPVLSSCADPLQNRATLTISSDGSGSVSGFVGFEAHELVLDNSEVTLRPSLMKLILESLPVNIIFRMCFRPVEVVIRAAETGFSETGLAIVLQRELVSLQINQIGPSTAPSNVGTNRGVRTALSNANGNIVQLSRPGTLSVIAQDGDCTLTSSGQDNQVFSARLQVQHLETKGESNTISGPGLDGVVGVGGAKSPGIYQVCFKGDAAGATFAGTGLSVLIQGEFVSLVVNNANPNRGLRASLPLSNANRLRYTSRSPVAQGHPDDMVSLISIEGDCMNPKDNPANRTAAGDATSYGVAVSDSSGYIRSEVGDMSFLNMKRVLQMRAGTYSVCFRPGSKSMFTATGIVAEIQNVITALVVNSVSSVMANVPKTPGNQVGYCVDNLCQQDGLANDQLSFINADLSCANLEENPVAGRVDKSGHLSPLGTTRFLDTDAVDVLFNEELGLLGVRVFQACFSRNGGPFMTTGLTLRVQEEILGLIINGVMPHNGLRTSLPKGMGSSVAYYRSTQGEAGEAISLIWDETENRKCDVHGASDNPVAGNSRASGYWAVNGADRTVYGSEWAVELDTGVYQVLLHCAFLLAPPTRTLIKALTCEKNS